MDILTFGEALIDLPSTQNGVDLAHASGFAKVPAGAPANVAVAACALGLSAAFVTKVGDDPFGEAIIHTFAGYGVDTSRIIKDPNARTGLAFVSLQANGERDFLFYFDPARDLAIRPDELDAAFIQSARVFHFGSISRIAEPCRSATQAAARLTREGGALCSYDPNLRLRLWPNEDAMRTEALAGFADANVAKISEEEVTFLVPEAADEPAAVGRLFSDNDRLKLICVTRGANGSTGYTRASAIDAPGFAVKSIDATGAGDAYMAGLLGFLMRQGRDWQATLTNAAALLPDALRYANACGALATTQIGGAPHFLTAAAVQALIQTSEAAL